MLVDSHVNLHGEKFSNDLDAVVKRAVSAGVGTMLNICCKLSDFDATLAIAKQYPNMWASVGTHPHDAKDNPKITARDLIDKTHDAKVIGIGETGLDYHYNYSEKDVQFHNFRAHIDAARETQLPLIIHSRNADDDMGDLLEAEIAKGAFPALLHCYTSGERLAQRGIDMGLYFAFSGIITFKKADDVRGIAAQIPDDQIMIETDCPYLSPVPHRGKRCEPAFVSHVADKLAEIKGWTIDDTTARTSDNFFTLFTKAKRPKVDNA